MRARRALPAILLFAVALHASRLLSTADAELAVAPARALVSIGDVGRLRRQIARARAGESIVLGAIGGSITEGVGASRPEASYLARVAEWWKQNLGPRVDVVNAGIGSTGSNYGALRARRDLLVRHPDVVIVEFAVNDPDSREASESLEGLCRQILSEPNRPAVILLFMMDRKGWSAEHAHALVGNHYHLPMVSFRRALLPEIQRGALNWDDVLADGVHPNDRGHAYAADFVTGLLSAAAAQADRRGRHTASSRLPAPLISDRYQHVVLREAPDLQPLRNSGWVLDPESKAWVADSPGSTIEFRIEGRVPLLMDWHFHGSMGKARIVVDDARKSTIRDGYSDDTWGWRATVALPARSTARTHLIRAELLDEANPSSTGHEFRILGLGAAGATPGKTEAQHTKHRSVTASRRRRQGDPASHGNESRG